MQNISKICSALKDNGIQVYISMVPNCKFHLKQDQFDYGKSLEINDAINDLIESDPKYPLLT